MAKTPRATSKPVSRSASKPAAKKTSAVKAVTKKVAAPKRVAATSGQVGILSNLNANPDTGIVVPRSTTKRTATYQKSIVAVKVVSAKSATKKTVKAPKTQAKSATKPRSASAKKSASKKTVKRH